MEISQKRFSNRTKFEFGEEELKYTIRDKGSAADFKINYAEFPVSSNMREERNEWLRNVGIIWILLGCFFLGTAILNDESISGKGFWIMVGAVCLIFYKFSGTTYSVYPTEKGSLFIIRDKKYPEIINEINSRKKNQLLEWHGEINRENDPQYEIDKFKWLNEQGVLTEEETENKIEQIKWSTKS